MKFLLLKIEFSNLAEKYDLKCSKSEQDPLNIKDFMAQDVNFCLPEGYSTIHSLPSEVTSFLAFRNQWS